MHLICKTAFVVTVAALLPQTAVAGTVGTTMPVTALTLNACAVVATPMVFGTLNQLNGTPNDSQSTVVVTCTPGTDYDVGLDNGAHATGGVRHMAPTLGSSVIPYGLFSNSTRNVAWGNTVGTNTVRATSGVLPTTLTVYGRVPGNALPVGADVYTDAVTVTVTF